MARPKAKSRHKRVAASAPQGVRRVHVIVLLASLLGLSLLTWLGFSLQQAHSEFRQLVEQGQPALSAVTSVPSEGRDEHVAQGSSVYYKTDPPLAGAHYPTPSVPGYYERPQLPGNLVHALEHGDVVIYYDRPSPEALQKLESWANRYQERWAGVIVTPMPGIGEEIVLTAWTKALRLAKFDAAPAAAFIDRFRGRGPEHPVR